MASFRRSGQTYDGHGVEPDVVVQSKPGDALRDRGDSVLGPLLERLRKK